MPSHNNPSRAAGAVPFVTPASSADAILAHAVSLGRQLRVSDCDLAKAALTAAVTIASEAGDPDGLMRELIAAATANE